MTDNLAAAIASLRAMIPLRTGDQDGRARQNRVSRIAIVCDACEQQAQEIARHQQEITRLHACIDLLEQAIEEVGL